MIQGLIFDKDGTLFDFNATWGAWAGMMIAQEAAGDPDRMAQLADAMGYDLAAKKFLPGSVVIASTVEETAAAMLSALPGETLDTLIPRMNAAAMKVDQIAAVPLIPFFDDLKSRGLRLGIATNDTEAPARDHLLKAGVEGHFDFIAGYDSGHGAKPGSGQLQAFCAMTGLDPINCAMIGDSTHDLHAGRAAGMTTIGVLTGPALKEELSPLADVVLPNIGHVPDWLDAQP